ncbi:hypothetical protein DFJ58DRAFT_740006 [Suillus subalutaceus]|uniref:uncharacterized protein n=1 Tax=Suillus subalutaceus TaxID=48586 RepID=UPI001B85CF9B|nr:uncharacterized protein DFJ58DRAFT_740006 [Suillus subalutaceus]KAG1814166.1 hypothetical protein DFJ58DRAFT_740006 [Suillus subalutaceus]
MPFHWISQWTGGFFEDTSLTKIGLEIHLGCQGKPCPEVTDDWYDTDDEGDNFAEGQWVPLVNDSRTTMVVDTSGVHSLMIRFCQCASALGPNMQLFEIGLFPASFTSPKTAFTFAVLDDFLLDNLECGTSAMNYYSKLRRITSSVFPHLVPDQYRELMRVGRQWRQLKQLKWHGFGHEKQKPKAGELALFCPACLQPGVNINLAERNVSNPAWLYLISLVMDGNFKAEHLFPANPTDEVALTDDLGFMVGDGQYKLHLAEAQDIVHRSDCNNHRAVNQVNTSRHKLEATGIGSCACARHGCFVPHSMVEFQKGESQRQMNMDYALCQALGYNTDGIDWALMFYDINCQYHKHLDQRVEESPYLDLPWGMEARWPAGEIHRGAVTWLASGITLEEAQVALLIDVKKLGRWLTDAQKLAIARRRNRMQGQIDEFVRVAVTFLGDQLDEYDQLDLMIMMLDAAELDSAGSSSDNPDRPDDKDQYDTPVKFTPETLVIPLPSNIGIERCAEWGVADLVLQEISLREGQANDAVHAIRVNLANKAVLSHTTVRSAKSQARSTRAWAWVHSVDKILHLNVQIYSKCCSQLIHLGANDLLAKFRPLEKADLKATTVVADPNARSQRNSTLAWFWSIDVQGDSTSNDWMNEFYCVHWLRMLAMRDRWTEELLLPLAFGRCKPEGRSSVLCGPPGSNLSPTLAASPR